MGSPNRARQHFVLGETGPTMNSGGLVLESFPLEHRSASLDLVLLVVESSQSLSISIRYNAELFDPSTIIRIGKYFETLLGHVVEQPDVRLNVLAEVYDRRPAAVAAERQIVDDASESGCWSSSTIPRLLIQMTRVSISCSKIRSSVRQTGCARLRGSASDLCAAQRPRKSSRKLPAHAGCGAGSTGGDLHGAVPRDGHRTARHSEGRRSLFADRSRLSQRNDWLSCWKMLVRESC